MSKTLDQIFIANPITTNNNTDLMYFSRSPYTTGNDTAMLFSDFAAQFGGSLGFATKVQVQKSQFNIGIDTGVADAYVVALTPTSASLTDGLTVEFIPLHTNLTTTPTVNVDGHGVIGIQLLNGNAVIAADIHSGINTVLQYDSNANEFFLQNPQLSYTTARNVQTVGYNAAADAGSVNAYGMSISLSPPGTLTDAFPVWVTNLLNTNTGASTFALNGGSALAIVDLTGSALTGGELVLHNDAYLVYNLTNNNWVLQNSALAGSGGGVTAAQVQQLEFNHATDSGAVNAYIGVFSPAISTTFTSGGTIVILDILTATNTGASTFDAGFGASAITTADNNPLFGGEMLVGNSCALLWNFDFGTWTLLNSAVVEGGFATQLAVQYSAFNYMQDTGTTNAIVVAMTPTLIGLSDGLSLSINVASANTGAATITADAFGPTPIADKQGNPLVGGEMIQNFVYDFIYTGNIGSWVLQNSSLAAVSSNPWSAGTGTDSAKGGDGSESAAGDYSVVYGFNGSHTAAGVQGTFVFGNNNNAVNGSGYSFLGGLNSGLNSASVGICWANNGNCNNANYFFCVGDNVTVNASWGFVFGLSCSTAAAFSLAVGNGSNSAHTGSYVWSDSNGSPATDSAADQWVMTYKGGYRFYTLATPTLVFNIDTVGNVINLLGQSDQSYVISVPTTGGTVTVANTNRRTVLNPAGTLATLTVALPTGIDGQLLTVTSTQIVTSLTVSSAGNTVLGAPAALAVGQSFTMIYNLSGTTWFPG